MMRSYYTNLPGSLPGALQQHSKSSQPNIWVIDYDVHNCVHQTLLDPDEIIPFLDSQSISWIDIRGLGDHNTLQKVGMIFNLHELVLEDICNVPQRPKVESHDNFLLVVMQMITLGKPTESTVGDCQDVGSYLHTEQVSFVLGEHYLLTVQEEPYFDTFQPIRDRLMQGNGKIRTKGTDYLAYCLIDTIIDSYFPVLELIGDHIEDLELYILSTSSPQYLTQIHQIKRQLLTLRRGIWPMRELLVKINRESNDLIADDVQIYLQDCYDHATQVVEMVEIYRELSAGLMELYLSGVNNRMNQVMQTLTVVSSIFIPLTFIVGVYGMNFNPQSSPWNMPELNWYWGYPLVWLVMGAIAVNLLLFFHRQGWLEPVFRKRTRPPRQNASQ